MADRAAAVRRVNGYLSRHVPITRAMGVRLRSFDASGVTMTAPLGPNINDKGIAFGGSLSSVLALSGWALTDLVLRGAGVEGADVIIASCTIEFRLPVAGPILCRCALPPAADAERFLAGFRSRGRAVWELEASVEGDGGAAAVFRGRYVARRRPAPRRAPRG